VDPVFLFVTGGVISSLGKGIAASAIGMLLEKQGYSVTMMKLDPYLNIDPGTMSPFQHGEVYVTDDGAETDLDLGHYFRYTDSLLSKYSTATSGQVYEEVLRKERRGDYLGATVQVIPHITQEIKRRLLLCADQVKGFSFVIAEIGGTVGDIESLPFLEAIRQFRYERPKNCLNLHLTYVPFMSSSGEIKTKPTQHSVQVLRQIGISPDLILCRGEDVLGKEEKAKISLFCNVGDHDVFDLPDVKSIYDVPLVLHNQHVEQSILERFGLKEKPIDLKDWDKATHLPTDHSPSITIGVVGKYVRHQDAYKSLYEALYHSGCEIGAQVKIEKIDPEEIEKGSFSFGDVDGYLVPGGFGNRGWEGKIATATYCRENTIPYFGICLGMQVLAVEFARNALGHKDANSTEVDIETKHPVISLLSEQLHVENLGGTMRLGSYPCRIQKKSKAYQAYTSESIQERHRHRYEFNSLYKQEFEEKGALLSGTSPDGSLCEIIEIQNHPWMVAVQFHPEFISKPVQPHPLFTAFLKAALAHSRKS